MKKITVVDARMGRGKSSAAIRYMNEHKGDKRFLYVTPYLAEVGRVCELCDFDEPGSGCRSKSDLLKQMMRSGVNIAATHVLFSLMDEESRELAQAQGYNLIVDESLSVIQSIPIFADDKKLILENFATVDDRGEVRWNNGEYKGAFRHFKAKADAGTLHYAHETMYEIMNPKNLLAFDEIFFLTYLFDGQLQKGYLDYYGFTYDIVGVEKDENGYCFSDKPDAPPPTDYNSLLNIIGVDDTGYEAKNWALNVVGEERTALSVGWFNQRKKQHKDVKKLRNNLRNFFDLKTRSTSKTRMWTTFKESKEWLYGQNNRYCTNFLPLNSRATNAFRDVTSVAYLANRFVNPHIANFFADKEATVDPDAFALSEMLQFIWRSAVRDDKPIDLYLPSKRMRSLLINWINENK